MRLNKASWAKEFAVSRAAVTLAVQSGKLVAGPDGWLDTDDQANREWIERRATVKPVQPAVAPAPKTSTKPKTKKTTPKAVATQPRTPAAAKPRKERRPAEPKLPEPGAELPDDPPDLPDTPDTELTAEGIGALSIQKIKAEIKYKTEAAEAYRIKRLERLGLLIEREHVRKTIGRYNAEQRIRLLEMPGTITPRLVAMARSGAAEHEVAGVLEDEIAKAIDYALAVFDRAGLGAP
jgi:hypothetical protein